MKNIFKLMGIIVLVTIIGFSFAACGGDDGGGGKDEEPVLSMTFTEDPYWNEAGHNERYRWLYKYKDASIQFDLSSMYANNKAYNFTYSFKSNIDIDDFAIYFQDKDGKGISDWTWLKGDIKKNTKYSGSAIIPPNSDAVGTSSADNFLVFYVKNRNVTTPSTMTFYKFSLELVDNENGSGGGGDNDTFNSLDDFKNWLNGKGNNSASSPYNVKLNLPNLSGLADFLKGLLGKFVKLDFSGSSFTSIGADAFKGLTNLTGITLPSGVTSIGANAFDGCTNLTNIILPSGINSIGASAFNGCTNLISVTFNGTITSGNFSSTTPFPGDLRDKYLAGGSGTYTRTSGGTTWTKQGGSSSTVIWTTVEDSKFGTSNITAIAFSGSRFVAVGESGKMAYSDNGTTWTAVEDSKFGTSQIYAVAYSGSRFVAVGASGKIAYSDNGTTWTAVGDSKFGTDRIYSIAYGSDKFVAVGNGGQISYSNNNGTSWTAVSNSTFTNGINSIAYSGNRFVTAGIGKMAYSDNGITWTAVGDSKFASNAVINGIAYGNSKFVVVGAGNPVYSTDNGVTWTTINLTGYADYQYGIAFGNNKFIAWGNRKLATSSDGLTWTAAGEISNSNSINGVAWGSNKFIAVGNSGKIAYWDGN